MNNILGYWLHPQPGQQAPAEPSTPVATTTPAAIPAVPEATLKRALDQVQDGLSTFWKVAEGRLLKVVQLTGMESGAQKVHDLVKANAEIIFLGLMFINLWQSWMLFALGAATGLAVGTETGQRFNIVKESIQILKTPQDVIAYDYLCSAALVVLAPWLCAFQAGVVAINHMAHPVVDKLPAEDVEDSAPSATLEAPQLEDSTENVESDEVLEPASGFSFINAIFG